MTIAVSPYQLGATLYLPATHKHLQAVLLEQKIPDLRSVVICLEDAIRKTEIPLALKRLKHSLKELKHHLGSPNTPTQPLIFIRPRHAEMALQLTQQVDIDAVNGFVLPKFDHHSFTAWQTVIQSSPHSFYFMPTLETAESMDVGAIRELNARLCDSDFKTRILALRIGGNDLLSCLNLRAHPEHTCYDGPLAYVIGMLVAQLTPSGFALTAPVMENFQRLDSLTAEFQRDLLHGFVGKTVIHPCQIPTIHQLLKVDHHDYDAAKRILATHSPAVFQLQGAMCEPSTHRRWAEHIMARTHYFGHRLQAVQHCVHF